MYIVYICKYAYMLCNDSAIENSMYTKNDTECKKNYQSINQSIN